MEKSFVKDASLDQIFLLYFYWTLNTHIKTYPRFNGNQHF